MTLLQLVELTLCNLGEDTDAETIAEYRESTGIISYINTGYTLVCERSFRPVKLERLTLSGAGFKVGQLASPVVSLEAVYRTSGRPPQRYGYEVLPDGSVLVSAGQAEQVDVAYRYAPQELLLDTDVPVFPARYHSCLSDYAAYRVLSAMSLNRQQRAQHFLVEFERKRQMVGEQQLAPGAFSAVRLKNKYN